MERRHTEHQATKTQRWRLPLIVVQKARSKSRLLDQESERSLRLLEFTTSYRPTVPWGLHLRMPKVIPPTVLTGGSEEGGAVGRGVLTKINYYDTRKSKKY